MAYYVGGNRVFVSPTCTKADLDGDVCSDVYVYEMDPMKKRRFHQMMKLVPKAALMSIAALFYAQVAIEKELERVFWIYVMFLPIAVYFGALYDSTTFPRRVGVEGLHLRLSEVSESMSFCWAQAAAFLPMVFAFVMILQMPWAYSWIVLLSLVAIGGLPVLAFSFACYRLRMVARARVASSRQRPN
jgi:hypothetical protein